MRERHTAKASREADPARPGSGAELLVAELLRREGYSIVAMNLRLGALEIDIVARKAEVIAVVEVRSRSTAAWTTGFGSLHGLKQHRIRLAGERLWRQRYRHDSSVERLRFDAASVRYVAGQAPIIEYVRGAF